MNLLLRLLLLPLLARRRGPCALLGPCRTPFRVTLTDLDVLLHVNNGVYLSIMDLARVDLMTRSGLLPRFRARGWYPVVAAETIAFHRSLRLGERFEVETSVLGWDGASFFLRQRFLRGEQLVADAVVRARFLARGGGTVAPEEVLALVDDVPEPPGVPEWVVRWGRDTARPARRPLAA